MSMANSVEFRVPFLKAELLDMSILNNSTSIFRSKIYTKIILRKLAEKYFKNPIYIGLKLVSQYQ